MSNMLTDEDDVQFSEPILAQKGVKVELRTAEKTVWKNKVDGNPYDALKLTVLITDDSVRTEHADAKPKLVIDHQFNIVAYPYMDKKTGTIKKLGRANLYQLETAFGFEPVFTVDGKQVEPYVTKTGNKVAPKTDGVKRVLNPDFYDAYFNADNSPKIENWIGKKLTADIEVEVNEQFGNKNTVARYLKPSAI